MNGVKKKYENSLKNTHFIDGSKLNPNHIKLDLSDLIKYAKNKGVRVCDLTEEEKSQFMHK